MSASVGSVLVSKRKNLFRKSAVGVRYRLRESKAIDDLAMLYRRVTALTGELAMTVSLIEVTKPCSSP